MEIHPQRAVGGKIRHRARADADFPAQAFDSKRFFPAHLVIVLSM
jgi:hypothetical protein